MRRGERASEQARVNRARWRAGHFPSRERNVGGRHHVAAVAAGHRQQVERSRLRERSDDVIHPDAVAVPRRPRERVGEAQDAWTGLGRNHRALPS